jgi:two-component system, NarL family, response regulator YdfI
MPSSSKIYVVVISNSQVIRTGLAAFADNYNSIELIGEREDTEQALLLCETHNPHVAVVDVEMHLTVEMIQHISEKFPDLPIIVLSSLTTQKEQEMFFDAGASAYLDTSTASIDIIFQTIKETITSSS